MVRMKLGLWIGLGDSVYDTMTEVLGCEDYLRDDSALVVTELSKNLKMCHSKDSVNTLCCLVDSRLISAEFVSYNDRSPR